MAPKSSTSAKRSRWAGVPAEDRKAERRSMLVDAAFDLLAAEGLAGTTVRGVCAASELNPRYFYESFDDLDALLVAVYDRTIDDLSRRVTRAVREAGGDAGAELRAMLDALVGFVDEDRRRGRVLYGEGFGNEALSRRRRETGQRFVDLIERDTKRRHRALPEGESIGKSAAAILVGGFTELIVEWLDGRIDVDRATLVDDATRLFSAIGAEAARIMRDRGSGADA